MSRQVRALGRELRPEPERPRHSLPGAAFGWLLRHLPEILLLVLAIRAWQLAAGLVGPLWTAVAGGALVAAALCWRRSRRWLLALLGCVLTRARLRPALAELRLARRDGRPPLVLAVLPTSVGERVWLLCPVPVSAEDVAEEADRVAAACFARDVRVREGRWSALVVLDVIRRARPARRAPELVRSATRLPARVAGPGA